MSKLFLGHLVLSLLNSKALWSILDCFFDFIKHFLSQMNFSLFLDLVVYSWSNDGDVRHEGEASEIRDIVEWNFLHVQSELLLGGELTEWSL